MNTSQYRAVDDDRQGSNVINLRDPKGRKLKQKRRCCFITPKAILEQVYDPSTRLSSFAMLEKGKALPTILTSVPLHDHATELLPVDNDLIHKGLVLLPQRPEPYGTTKQLIQRIREHIRRYLVLPAEIEEVVYHYILFTWVFDRFDEVPYLRLIGDIGVGKSKALKIIGELCYRPFIAYGGASLSSIFRSLEILGGATVVLDELELVKSRDDHQDLMQMLRVGFQKPGIILRSESIDGVYQPKAFEVFGPKVLAGRGPFPDAALESRCVRVYMQSGVDLSRIQKKLPNSYPGEGTALRNQLLQWRADHYWTPLRDVDMPQVEPRLEQLFRPLASLIDDEQALEALKASILLHQEELTEGRRISPEGHVAAALVELSRDRENFMGTEKRIYLQEVVDHLKKSAYEIYNRKVGTICKGFGLTKDRDNDKTFVLFDPAAKVAVLERYGLM